MLLGYLRSHSPWRNVVEYTRWRVLPTGHLMLLKQS